MVDLSEGASPAALPRSPPPAASSRAWFALTNSACSRGGIRRVRDRKDRVCQPLLERGIVAELLEELGVVLQHGGHHARERLVVLDACVLLRLHPLPSRQRRVRGATDDV